MIRISHATLKMLRAGRVETVTIPARDPEPPAKAAPCPWKPDRQYLLFAAATEDFKRDKIRATVLDTRRDGGSWVLTFRANIAPEEPRFLKARPGGMEGDYTSNPALGATGEPEPVDEQTAERFARDGRAAEEYRRGWERLQLARELDDLITRLVDRGSDDDRVALVKLRAARQELVRRHDRVSR